MGKIINAILGRPQIPEDTTVGEVNRVCSMNDAIYPMQIFLNGIKNITDRSGWDIESWSMKDVIEFMEITTKCVGEK